jgi:hypothetical protein
MEKPQVFTMPFSRIYLLLIQKAEKKEEQSQKYMKPYFSLPVMMNIYCNNK